MKRDLNDPMVFSQEDPGKQEARPVEHSSTSIHLPFLGVGQV